MTRLRELDFLRGIAIVLVLFRHQHLSDITQKIGWIGVDLFFVLSGFLVSGLLFREFQKYGDVRPGLFLVRRGFKIYPLYYLSYCVYLVPILIKSRFEWSGFLADMFFVQNYLCEWGWAYDPSWTLAVEEHFYFGFAGLVLLGTATQLLKRKWLRLFWFEWVVIMLITGIVLFRVASYGSRPDVLSVTMSHLRIDSMLAGVLVACAWHFHREALRSIFSRFKWLIVLSIPVLVSCSALFDQVSFFMGTIGFTLLYIGFALLLTFFLCDGTINRKLDRVFSPAIVNFVARIGLASYSIYIIHTFVNYACAVLEAILKVEIPAVADFVLTSGISIGAGWLMTRYIEGWFLKVRDRHFPSRASVFN